ncbi:chloride channel protein [Sphingomonas gilva]|uniref:Chloride channel protein n=1 Tax=Sphingomonas gilva TaxID=2305907 RepID=A0A396RXQ4_9SPHN|nr:chloride channel protein [Sphingomonas gilva]RHW18501.1 chloride channel protein [Sphingomonas gilva]
MAVVVGTGGAFAAWLLLKLIALVTNLAWFGRLSVAETDIADTTVGLAGVAIPVIGSLIVGLIARYGSEKIRGHGIPEAIETILYGESRLSAKVAVLKPVSSAISIGSGGPFGAEGPIIMTGGAIGSLFAQCFHLTAAERKTLLVAGAAAGMTAIFGTPVAAVLLAVEVLLFEWKPRSFVPVVVGALVAIAWRPLLIDQGALFPFASAMPVTAAVIALAIGVGALAGAQAAGLSAMLYRIEDLFHRLRVHWMWWPALGAVAVGLGGVLDPRVLGAGYGTIQALLDGDMIVRALLLLLVVKAVVWLIALGSGTSGGVVAPLLILGGALGCLEGQFLPGSPGFWALLGMAGILAGAMRAPLTGALFAVELTGRFEALPATLAAAAAAYAVTILISKRSILTEKIARRGRHVLQEYGVNPIELTPVSEIMVAPVETLPQDMPVRDAVAFFESAALHRSYPVVDGEGRPVGMVSRSDALRWRGEPELADATLAESMSDASLAVACPDDLIGEVADRMIAADYGRMPVVDRATRKLVGLVARHDMLRVRAGQQHSEKVRSRF